MAEDSLDPDALPDEVLARALISKEARATRIAWERFSPMVRRILRRSLGAEIDAEDLLQDVFVRLFSKVHQLQKPGALRAFVIAITTLTVRQELRRRALRRWIGLGRDESPSDPRAMELDPVAREALVRLYAILNRFATRDRMAFVLHFVEGMKLAEVSAALGVSLATTKRGLSRVWSRVVFHVHRDPLLADYLAPHLKELPRE